MVAQVISNRYGDEVSWSNQQLLNIKITMFQSAAYRSKTPNRFFYNTRSLPKSCSKQLRLAHKFNSISISSENDSKSDMIMPQRSYSTIKITYPKKQKSFTSVYSSKSRYENIMGLKTKKVEHKSRSMSFSLSSEQFQNQNKQNYNKQESRLDKIMSISVVKPTVDSTLKNYQPSKKSKAHPINRVKKTDNGVSEWRQCRKKIAKIQKQEEKENMLWKSFEREREKRYVQAKKQQQKEFKREREREVRFEKMVEKQLKRIQAEREVKKRQNRAFSPYLYPLY